MKKERFHKAIFLFKLLAICLIFFGIQRVLFLLMFYSHFSEASFIEFIKAFLVGALTDGVTSIYFLLPMWLILLFFNIEQKLTKKMALGWFVIGFTLACILNLSDFGYYPVTKKRMGAELLDILPEIPSLLASYLQDYWYLVILLFGFLIISFLVLKKQLNNYRNGEQKISIKLLNILFVLFGFFTIMRGGYGTRPFTPFDIPSMVDPKLQWLASNTPFQLLHTLENENIKIKTYFDETQAEKMIGFEKHFKSKEFKKKNVLFIILESFCSERIGLLNPSIKNYTPFMDSLLSNARTYKYGVANGRMTIDALPSVLSGIPCFMEKNYCYSNYNNNNVHGISALLEKEGYNTAFFYGGLKTTFGFENFMNINFTKNYYDQEDYDNHYENTGWGVDDHLFLPFVAEKLNNMPQPFCASLLTLSLHHPFPIPEPYKTLLDSIKDPVKKSMKYTDLSLQIFFNKIRNEEWYKNSIIAICADHTSGGFGNYECNQVNEFTIPISFLAVGDTAFNKIQDQSISQVDMYPTILDYLGYDQSFVALGNSALSKQHPSVQYGGNGMFVIFDFPYALEYDSNNEKVTKLFEYSTQRKATYLLLDDYNKAKIDRLTNLVKAYIQVFSYRVNKNQF
ncbi:MAG: sulfatase-like hydrolase/transferase [Burkholderiales bacterium]|nr:sulfatase-like hydrolase/transferase [Bacteroidia bacterium]